MPKLGWKHSEDSKNKISASLKGKTFSVEHAKNHLAAVRISTQKSEYRSAMSKTKKGISMPTNSLTGASETNKNAKDWWFIKDSVHYRFRSVSNFVRQNKHLFTDWELKEYTSEKRLAIVYRATIALRSLHLIKKNGRPVIPSHQWNGWTIGEKWDQGYYDNEL